MQKFNLSRKLFDFKEQDSDRSMDSVIYISSDSEDEVSDFWDSEWSTDTDALINRIKREVKSSPILIGGRAMTVEGPDDEMVAGPSNSQPGTSSTPKLGPKYFDKKLFYAPPKELKNTKIELCKTLLTILESPMSPPAHERGPPQDVPQLQSMDTGFHASYHIQGSQPHADLSSQRCLDCMVWQVCRQNPRAKNKTVHGKIYATRRTGLRYEHQAGSLYERSQCQQFAFLGTRSAAGCRLWRYQHYDYDFRARGRIQHFTDILKKLSL